tara:strand:- start:62 stop:484 length:423 start_codon:yes stop_codon:yes gene_type:complete
MRKTYSSSLVGTGSGAFAGAFLGFATFFTGAFLGAAGFELPAIMAAKSGAIMTPFADFVDFRFASAFSFTFGLDFVAFGFSSLGFSSFNFSSFGSVAFDFSFSEDRVRERDCRRRAGFSSSSFPESALDSPSPEEIGKAS